MCTLRQRPLDDALRERLHLKENAAISLCLIRAVLQSVDTASRTFLRHPFFALNESETVLDRLNGLKGRDLVRAILGENGGTRISPHGIDNIPQSGPVVIAATHPTGMFDFLAHAGALLEKRPDLKVVANQETEKFLGAEIIVPVRFNKQNQATSSAETHRAMDHHLNDGGALLIFGSGRVSHRKKGRLVEPDWRSGASRISQKCNAPIVPAALDTQNSGYYYRIRSLAQFVSGGNDNFGAMIGSLRYTAEFLRKLGGQFDVFYDAPLAPGTAAHEIKTRAEQLVPGLYATIRPA